MSESIHTYPTARIRHRCALCDRLIMPGETYWRQVWFDMGAAATTKVCEHCDRVVGMYCRAVGESEWLEDDAWGWLEEAYPAEHAAMAAGWRWPDGELVPVPFGSRCFECGCRIAWGGLWCSPCDDARIARLNQQFAEISRAFKAATS